MTTGKTIALTRRTFVDKVMSLLFNMLSRLAMTFFRSSKPLLISRLQSPSAVILEPMSGGVLYQNDRIFACWSWIFSHLIWSHNEETKAQMRECKEHMTQIQDPKPQKEDIQAPCLLFHHDFNVIRLASFFFSLLWELRCSSLIIHLLNTP